jgi:branched-chain amino acid transport system permease protein
MEKALALPAFGVRDRLRGLQQPYRFITYLILTLVALAVARWILLALWPETLYPVLTQPFETMYADWPSFFLEVLISGILTGVMYALVALGFVLIFKASGMFNFAQGVMVLFAALNLVGMIALGLPIILALVATAAVMIALSVIVEALVLRHLVNQHEIILFMATIGLAFFLEGFGEMLWGGNVRKLDIGLPTGHWEVGGVLLQQLELTAAVMGALLVGFLAFFFQKTKIGRALRAVADDHQAALSVGISLRTIWIFVWSTAGIVALVAGIVWGSKSGVQFSLSLIALKALPVLILGGLTSIPGAIVGGLIIGVGEKVFELYWGPAFGGATENWFAYVLALAFLLFRPQGLFGERIIERV